MINPHVVTASALRLRASPQLDSEVLASLARGTVVELLDTVDKARWAEVRTGRKTGWMATKYLVPRNHPTAPPKPSEEFSWMHVALAEVGVAEAAGVRNAARVLEYLGSTDLDTTLASEDSTPWCAAFANWCVEHAGVAGTNSARARSWLDWGRPLLVPRRGCITVLSRDKGGHVGFYLGKAAGALSLLGGNQGDQVAVAPYPEARLLGYRVPA